METVRTLLSKAHALLEAFSCWTPDECEGVARRVLVTARRVCHGDEGIVRANLIAALIMSCEEKLRDDERELLDNLKERVSAGS